MMATIAMMAMRGRERAGGAAVCGVVWCVLSVLCGVVCAVCAVVCAVCAVWCVWNEWCAGQGLVNKGGLMTPWRGCLSVVCALSCVFLVLEHQQMAHRSS